ncbi:MAG: hypothetical protein ORN54_12200 [Cyclobacteriaceae bacterium]|nr:hypothetical protein [Cyclobacteriaceae bacterium]
MNLITEIDKVSGNLQNVFAEMKKAHAPDHFSSGELQNNELRRLGEELKDLKQDRDERKSYAFKLYWLVLVWLLMILLIILFQGLQFSPLLFKLSDAVLITLITTTTANVAAFFLVVVRYLFRPKK